MKKVKLLIFALMALFLTTAAWVAADDDTGTVTVVHGVPGLTVPTLFMLLVLWLMVPSSCWYKPSTWTARLWVM